MKKISKKNIARHLRQEQTPAEEHLWQLLRNRQFEDLKFRRQHPIKKYIVDFCCLEIMLVIELDGAYHNDNYQKEKDDLRDAHLRGLGYRVLRYPNKIALENTQIIYDDILKRKEESTPSLLREKAGMRVLSTKKLKPNQRELLLNAGVSFVEYDAISIAPIDFEIPEEIENIIITSQNGAKFFINKLKTLPLLEEKAEARYFAVGEKTTALLEENNYKVAKTAQNGAELGHFIVKNHKNGHFTYFCGKQRRDELPTILKEAAILCNEIVTYETHLNEQSFIQKFDGILFYSPSAVSAFAKANKINKAFCIGNTTATEARKYTDQVIVSNATTIESTIAKAVNTLKKLTS
ncbi:hypothetical protein GCM10011344_12450 [Dokdonia pacifica]|uniref:Uroporphyrinogen-III synthase n=1 Tax=Dokdonia pacifica TaxID=1627892 RepID=A0A238WBY7_9FLAO|nr:DUF559 domain-containing protein [Dokdonia pacifica]GGG13292.1 hypothetical protein GCM10011344_12450 [Dokdonia pacifica]SNR43891.1 uroporphyrinogen-III synthase [Dokdonia pacifica]